MSRLRIWVVAVGFSIIGWVIPLGVASADCTTAGDFGAGAGCAPPGSTTDNSTESWPPTSVDWPPQLKPGSDSENGGEGGNAKPTPIVMPSGQKPPPTTAATSTSTAPTPIVMPQG